MHTLTLFPQLLTFQLIAPTLLRLTIGIILIFIGKERFSKKFKWSSVIYVLSGILLILGLYTQAAAIAGIVMIKFDFWIDKKSRSTSKEHWLLYVLATTVLFSLMFTGPGFLAFDLPL
jgi:uncharacterized membrane protein YphA (DoxX/SURF4 family)